jgi:hypothetical protein
LYKYGTKINPFFWFSEEEFTDIDEITDVLKKTYFIDYENEKCDNVLLKTIKTNIDMYVMLEIDKLIYDTKNQNKTYDRQYIIFNEKIKNVDVNEIENYLFYFLQLSVLRNINGGNECEKSFGCVYKISVGNKNYVDSSDASFNVALFIADLIFEKIKGKKYETLLHVLKKAKLGEITCECLKMRKTSKSKIDLKIWLDFYQKKYDVWNIECGLNNIKAVTNEDKNKKLYKLIKVKAKKKW